MFSDQRQEAILNLVREVGFVSIEALAERFNVTPQTIRRSVNGLCEMALLRRVHGGVDLLNSSENLAYENRQVLNLPEKRLIGRHVAAFIPDGASVLIGLGTTPEYVARAFAYRKNLTVFTNSLNVAAVLARNAGIEITIPGGTYRRHDRDIIGEAAAAFFMRFKADFAVFGVGGVDEDGGFLDFNEGEVEARKAMVASCRTAILAADTSKFGRVAPFRGGHLGDVDHVFTDRSLTEQFNNLPKKYGVEVHVAETQAFRAA